MKIGVFFGKKSDSKSLSDWVKTNFAALNRVSNPIFLPRKE